MESIESNPSLHDSSTFQSSLIFDTQVREPHDIYGLPGPEQPQWGPYQVILLVNALHELGPWLIAPMFRAFYDNLAEGGKVCIADMEALPFEEEEVEAVMWERSEVEKMLELSGFEPNVTVHPKKTKNGERLPTFSGTASKCSTRCGDPQRLGSYIRDCVGKKLTQAIVALRGKDLDYKKQLVACGRVARCADALEHLKTS